MLRYTDDMTEIAEDMLTGFFDGWPRAASSAQHLAVLRGSYRAVVAIDRAAGRAVGFVHMISDGVLTASVPWLEVLPAWRGRGIGTELMRRVLQGTEGFYSVDLLCDASGQAFYGRFGMAPVPGMTLRRQGVLDGDRKELPPETAQT
ncbi:GNAT family N-acetyltransferase [Streptomyces avicenniae]|uniref:GNAT family N-acetyltransferase n=1 Tax=Streptomyces avicenniae TaxID=500153 RepID=UPI000ADDB00E|nr:GNAT family N-acetyltransferase [Streptomyces avicenniae]